MIDWIITFSIRNRMLVIFCVAAMAAWGVFAMVRTPIDAIPDLSENQVIVFTDWMGRSPQEVEDQITYPLSVNLQGLAGVRAVRATSEFNYSMINIIFEDGVDFYFARTRVLERLSTSGTFLPSGVFPRLAPDATALGQIFWYTVEGGGRDLGELRAIQDWQVRYALNSVAGVAQVASVGGFVREYQIDLKPDALRSYNIPIGDVYSAVANNNNSVGGNTIEQNRAEILVRGIGWLRNTADIENSVVTVRKGVPILIKDLGTVQLGPQFRRSVLEKDGGEAVGGVVMMRFGEDPLTVTRRIHQKIEELAPGLPDGVRIVPFYERTRLIHSAMETLGHTLLEEMIVAGIAVLLVLAHLRSVLVICIILPLSVLFSFILMHIFKIPSNIMSLSGIAISIGVLIDAAIVITENAHHRLQQHFGDEPVRGDTRDIVLASCKTVGAPLFFSIMIMLISFMPVMSLTGTEGKMFHPLAFTKGFALLGVAVLAITLIPALIPTFVRGRLRRADANWIVRGFLEIYRPMLGFFLKHPDLLLIATGGLMVVSIPLFPKSFPYSVLPYILPFVAIMPIALVARYKLVSASIVLLIAVAAGYYGKPAGEEFMPPLDEGSILDMPVTVPRAGVTQVRDDLVRRDAILMRFPEVESVVGKAGRADTATDPSPIDMVESIINLKPRPQWPKRKVIFNDAAAEAAQLFDSMRLRGRFASTLTDLQRKDIINESAMNAVARFDAFARVLCLERFAAMPAVPDSDADAAEPWYSQIINPAIQLFDTEPESPALARAARFGRAREAAAVEFINGINRELIQRGSYQLLSFLAEELLLGAQRRAALTAGPDDTATEARAAALERTPEFTKTFFLWQKQKGDLLQELDTEVRMPGWGNIWTQPIINRVDMLATGVRSMVGVKVFGDDRASTVSTIQKIQDLSNAIAQSLKTVPGAVDVVADQSVGEMYLDINFDRARAARYGVTMADVGELIEVAVGGKPVTETVEGRRRFPVRVRYGRDFVEDAAAIRNILLSAKGGDSQMVMIPLSEVADVRLVEGPTMIKSEDGKLRAYVQLNVRDRDIVSFVDEAQRAVAAAVAMPAGFHIEWSGQFEHQVHARKTLQLVFPAAILLIFVILYITYKDLAATGIMALAVPGAIAGAAICQWLWGCNFSVAVWVGYIACFGMATGTAIVMLVYLREAIDNRGGLAKIQSESELATALMEGAVHRLRPKLLTEATTILGLVPMLWATGTGAEVMRPMAVPILGGILVADEVIDLLVPVLYYSLMRYRWRKLHNQ